ncbi:hypothetical protein KG118_00005, partial [Bacteroides sp. NSJ-90]|uniref:hypothetical protein n=1 Tax=Bacteroides propionicigenes TaxID=2834112 RepID=UPI0037430642|nr:hypothetical protein [Bacteroides propionicigenes]
NLFKDRFFFGCSSFSKADAKVRTFKYIFQIFPEVFFLFLFLVVSLAKGRTKKKECRYRPPCKKYFNQRLLSF